MDDTQFQQAFDRLAAVQPRMERNFVIGGKSGVNELFLWIGETKSTTQETLLGRARKASMSWKVAGKIHKQQGKYIFVEEASEGSVREAMILRAINQQLKQKGELWGKRQLSALPGMWVSAAMAVKMAEQLQEPEPDTTTSTTSTTSSTVVEEVTDEFDNFADLYFAAQADVILASQELEQQVQGLIRVLTATTQTDANLREIGTKDVPEFLEAKREGMLEKIVKVGVTAPDARKGAVEAAQLAIDAELKKLTDRKNQVEAMEKHQPDEGVPVNFTKYKATLTGITLVNGNIITALT